MLRRVFLIFLLGWSVGGYGQNVVVPKSTDMIVLQGKSYYLHVVRPGQTLYSICKAYGVEVEEVKSLNHKKENALSLYEVLKIPYVEVFVRRDEKYYYHKAVGGETLYSIARHYGIKPKRLLKLNHEYAEEGLAVGTVVRLPLDEIDGSVWSEEEKEDEMGKDRMEKLGNEKDIAVEVAEGNPAERAGSGEILPPSSGEGLSVDRGKELPEYLSEVVLPEDPFVKVALLLPFSAAGYEWYTDTLGGKQSVNIPPRTEQFIDFYEGILLSVDSLKNRGYKIKLHVFDTERSGEKAFLLAEEINRLHPDLIIGPVYGSVYKEVAEQLTDKEIPLVYPLSSRSENCGEYSNFVQVNASFETMAAKMTEWLERQSANGNVVHIRVSGEGSIVSEEKRIFGECLGRAKGVRPFYWNMEKIPLDALRSALLPDRENILVLPDAKETEVSKILPLLAVLADDYRITVVGLPEWLTFGTVDYEIFYKLNTKIFTYSYVDYDSSLARTLADRCRKFFYSEPGSLVFKAFDMGLYFIELAAKYRDRTLDAIEYYGGTTGFSRFRFEKMRDGQGKENQGFHMVNFGSDYRMRMETPD